MMSKFPNPVQQELIFTGVPATGDPNSFNNKLSLVIFKLHNTNLEEINLLQVIN